MKSYDNLSNINWENLVSLNYRGNQCFVTVSYAWWRSEQYVVVLWNIRTFPPPTHPGHLTFKNPSKSCDKPLRQNPTG
jgi:hypothetical protein